MKLLAVHSFLILLSRSCLAAAAPLVPTDDTASATVRSLVETSVDEYAEISAFRREVAHLGVKYARSAAKTRHRAASMNSSTARLHRPTSRKPRERSRKQPCQVERRSTPDLPVVVPLVSLADFTNDDSLYLGQTGFYIDHPNDYPFATRL